MEAYPGFIAEDIKLAIKNNKYLLNNKDKIINHYLKLNKKNPWSFNCIVNEKNDKLRDIVDVKQIKYGTNRKLIGEMGLFSKKKIIKGTVLGIYIGDIYKENDYEAKHGYSADDLFEICTEAGKLIIAPKCGDMILRYINDSRTSMNDEYNDNDNNISCKQICIDGVPCIILFASKNIGKYVQLFMSYGINYWRIKNIL